MADFAQDDGGWFALVLSHLYARKKAQGWGTGELRLANHLVDNFAISREQRNGQRHLAEGVGRAAQARVEGAHHGFDAIEKAFSELAVLDVMTRGLCDSPVHGVVVLAGGDHEVGPGNQAVLIHLVVMVQGSARRLGLPGAFETIDAGHGANVLVEDVRIGEDLLDLLDAVENVDEAGVVVIEGTLHGAKSQLLELGEFNVGQGCAHGADNVQPGQRSNAIAAVGIAEWLVVSELGVGVGLDGFANNLGKVIGGDSVFDQMAARADQAEQAVSEFDGLVFVDEAEIVGREVGKDFDFRPEAVGDLLVGGERQLDAVESFGHHGQDFIALGRTERFGDAAGHDPSGMDALVAEEFDDVLAEPAQRNASAAEFRLGRDYAEDVAHLGIGFHSKKQIGGGQVEEAQ